MLEFNRQLLAQGPAALGEAAVLDSSPSLPTQGLAKQVVAGFSLVDDALVQAPELAVEAPAVLDPAPPPAVEGAAEQWLLGMLGQREQQVEAHDAVLQAEALATTKEPGSGGLVEALELLPLALPLPQTPERMAEMMLARRSSPESSEWPTLQTPRMPMPMPMPELVLERQAKPEAAGWALVGGAAAGRAVAGVEAPLAPLAPALLAADSAAQTVSGGPSAATPQPAQTLLQQRLILQAPEARWGEQMLQALRDSVEVQMRQGVQQASIRLDPPELGSMEIFLSHESGRLSVQISSSNADVARLLQQTSERLRQELVGSNFLQVSVQVGSDGQSGHERQRQAALWQDDAISAAQVLETASSSGPSARDVLVTV